MGMAAGATTISPENATSSTNLFEGLGVEASEGVDLNGIAYLDGGAADLTVLDVGVTAY